MVMVGLKSGDLSESDLSSSNQSNVTYGMQKSQKDAQDIRIHPGGENFRPQ